jgi:monodechloroaminopyrrolnitrin synthase
MELPEFVPDRVAALDPLRADDACARLPKMNAHQDTDAMARALSELLPTESALAGLTYDESLAAMRDLGMFVSSLRRHGVEPVCAVPEAEPVLIELGRRTDMIPRDTIHHYTEMNPVGPRVRTFTGDAVEAEAIDGIRLALRRFATAVGQCARLAGTEPSDPEFPVLLGELATSLGTFTTVMNLITDNLPADFFYEVLLPYYNGEAVIAGSGYIGPTAAHVPLAVIDTLVWESDHGTRELADYRLWALPYTMPRWRALRAEWSAVPSLATRVAAALADPPAGAEPVLRESAAGLTAVLRALVVFRAKHMAYARKGSSAEGVALLRDVIDQTRRMSASIPG